jgi:signal peptidase II
MLSIILSIKIISKKKEGPFMLFYIIAIFVILMDQLSKYLIRIYIDINEQFTWRGIELTHIENSGMAGGLFPGHARLFGLGAVLFVIGVLYIRRTGEMNGALIDSSFGFLVGGGIGNGIDRLLFGQVTDFIIRSGGVLNLADHAIEIGVILLIIYVVVSWIKNKL